MAGARGLSRPADALAKIFHEGMSTKPHHPGPRAAHEAEPHDADARARQDHARHGHKDHAQSHRHRRDLGHDLSHVKPVKETTTAAKRQFKRSARRRWSRLRRGVVRVLRHRTFRRLFWSLTLAAAVVMVAAAGLWWRLNSGPIELDIATPWLKQAIEENFGAGDQVSVGGTQIERDEKGRTSLRLRDIEVRNAEGVVVASAPKAEVGLSGLGLLYGRVRAQSLNLVEAAMSIRIETDGRITVFAGGENRPIATAPPTVKPVEQLKSDAAPADPGTAIEAPRTAFADLAGIMTWIDNVGARGLDGHELREVGLKNGSLLVDDRRTGKRLTFDRINASLTRPEQGGVVFRLESVNPERPWIISAAMRPLADGVRALGLEARKVSTRDLLLAARLDTSGVEVDLPISASVRAEVGADGMPNVVQGEIFSDAGTLIDHGKETIRYDIDRIDARFNWDARRGNLIVPFQVNAGPNQFTLRATLEPPAPGDPVWRLEVTRGDPVIDPVILGASGPKASDGLALNRVNIRARIDPAKKRIDLDQGDISRVDNRPLFNVAVAVTGSLDFSGEPHIAFGVAGTRMPMPTMMKLWPAFAAREVREWVAGHIGNGIVERVVVAGNAPMNNFKDGGPPTPEDGLSVDIETSATTLRPVDDLPEIRDADLSVRVTGGTATVNLGRGTVEAGGRKLNVASGVFSIPNTHLKPAPSITTFRVDGTVPAAAALLASDGLRDKMGLTIDPAASRGTMSAQVTIKLPLAKEIPPGATSYTVDADLQNFAADKLLLGQKIEAQTLKVNASSNGYSIKGDVKINGTAAKIDLRRGKGDDAAQLIMTASIDEAARRRLGFDFGASVTGTIPVKATGAVGDNVKDERLNIDADLTPVKIENLLPGWMKPAGKPARATYTMIKSANRTRFDDLSIEGGGASVKGTVEIDNNGNLLLANFPTFALSDGDKLSVKADRGENGALKVLMRGDVYDGRNFVKSSLAGADEGPKGKQMDLDLDIRIGAVAGHNGETLRGLDLKLSRRGGQIRTFNLNAKIGRDTPLSGDLRLRARDNHRVVYLETDDAGALFRFTDTYPRIFGGRMWIAMDPPTQEQTPQVGTIVVRDFVVRGEPALDRIVATSGASGPQGVGFAEGSAGFTKTPGRMSVRDGVVRGPLVGATVEGQVDFARNEMHLRGTFVPLYGLNNIFGLGQIPIVGLFLGGSNEGLLGITYEATGAPGAPRISVNPVSAIAPGLLRKFIPSPGTFDPKFMPAPQ